MFKKTFANVDKTLLFKILWQIVVKVCNATFVIRLRMQLDKHVCLSVIIKKIIKKR